MSDIYSLMKKYIADKEMLAPSDSILAAVSGGADSMCMLDLLVRYAGECGFRIGVVNIDHGFRPEAVEEAEYVGAFCRDRHIPFFHEKIRPGSIRATEEEARLKRYELIGMIAEKEGFNRIALAHNMQDRAETMLFNMIRGSGIPGMIGINPVRDRFIRPVMCLSREQIEEYLEEKKIFFYTDSTNLTDDYSRNRIRHNIIPETVLINSGSIRHMNTLAEEISEVYDYLEQEADSGYREAGTWMHDRKGVRLQEEALNGIDPVIRKLVFRKCLSAMTPHLKDITRDNIECLESLLHKGTGSEAYLPYGIKAYRDHDAIYIESGPREQEAVPLDVNIDLDRLGSGDLVIPFGKGKLTFSLLSGEGFVIPTDNYSIKAFDYDKINKLLTLRYARPEDKLIIDSAGHTKTVNRYMIDTRIPERERSSIPVLADSDSIIWIIGYRDSYAFRIDKETKRILNVKLEGYDGRTC